MIFSVALLLPLSLEAAKPASFCCTQGSITFSQGGKESTWTLYEGATMNGGGSLAFTPDGKAPADPKAPIVVIILGRDKKKNTELGDIGVVGSAARWDLNDARMTGRKDVKCTLASISVDDGGAKGSGACEDPRALAAVIDGFSFDAKP